MVRRYYGLPPLTALAVFEATARHASVRRAAKELNVTPSAVSRQIRALEEELGLKLFSREANGVELTDAAQDLFDVLASSFANCRDVIRTLKAEGSTAAVTFACTDSFANLWLMPRMPDFWGRYPHIAVNHLVSDNPRDFRRADVDLFVRFGKGAWSNEHARKLFGDTVYPVCGSAFAQERIGSTLADLPLAPLLQIDWNDPEWITWEEILQIASIPYGLLQRRRFGTYGTMLAAAEANQGVAIGWDALVRRSLETGRLVRFTDIEIPIAEHYYLVWTDKRPLSDAAETLKAWLVEQAGLQPTRPYGR